MLNLERLSPIFKLRTLNCEVWSTGKNSIGIKDGRFISIEALIKLCEDPDEKKQLVECLTVNAEAV